VKIGMKFLYNYYFLYIIIIFEKIISNNINFEIYIWKIVWILFFYLLWVLPVTDIFSVQLPILIFDCKGVFKSFDNTVFGHPPIISKRRISIQNGANWESWSGTTNIAIFSFKFGYTHKIPIFFQYHIEKK
jgi:hypothetical protein